MEDDIVNADGIRRLISKSHIYLPFQFESIAGAQPIPGYIMRGSSNVVSLSDRSLAVTRVGGELKVEFDVLGTCKTFLQCNGIHNVLLTVLTYSNSKRYPILSI